ncbi:MAG: hypothetical protein ABIP55_09085 [Tepidisphaeraceae bacterium]
MSIQEGPSIMGYFKRPVRRSAARAQRLELLDGARNIEIGAWQPCERLPAPARDTFLRFVVERPRGGGNVGLFRISECIEDSPELPASARSQMRAAFRWFNTNLSAPRRLPKAAICWFRADAQDSLERIRTLIEIYRLLGYPVSMQATRSPGRVVYRDEYQVAAVPHRDRRVTSSAM